ncbi:MAG: MoaD/ThiS family protein [Dehalococcoidia bacterium]
MATVQIPALLRELTGGTATLQAAGSNLREVLADVVRQQPGLANRVYDAAGVVPEIMLVVDNVEALGLDTPVGPNSEVLILPALQGG